MPNENDPNPSPRRYRHPLPALTKAELEMLLTKRYISKQEVMRIFNLSETDFYEKLRSGCIVQASLGKTKLYDLSAIYQKLEDSTRNPPPGNST